MEAKHTKNEWICKGSYRRVATNESLLDEFEICKISGNHSEGEIIANAKLIAAAPELLEALQEIMDSPQSMQLLNGQRFKALNAIKKATE